MKDKNILISFMLLVSLFACENNASIATNQRQVFIPSHTSFSSSTVDLEQSYIYWKGTKLMHSRHHEGTFKLVDGNIEIIDGSVHGGKFIVDINSLHITDIPAHEKEAISNISGHLLEDLSADLFPYAEFSIEKILYTGKSEFQIDGMLKIREVSKKISFHGHHQILDTGQSVFKAELEFDRFDWNVGSDGSWLEKKLVDPEVLIKIHLVSL